MSTVFIYYSISDSFMVGYMLFDLDATSFVIKRLKIQYYIHRVLTSGLDK
jgi:hypothetical protein